MKNAPINEIVSLLDQHSPETLSSLRQKYPAFKNTLKPGQIMGDEEDDESRKKFEADVSITGMKTAMTICEKVIPDVKKRLIFSKRIKLSAQVLSVIGGASIFTLLSQDPTYAQYAKYISAGIVLVGTVLPLFAQYMESGFFAEGTTLSSAYEELVSCKLEAQQLLPQIEFRLNKNMLDSIDDLTIESNRLSKRINEIVLRHLPTISSA